MRTLIGCVASYDEERVCLEKPAEVIHALGANLVFLSHTREAAQIQDDLDLVDGLLLGGGIEDLSPTWQHEPPHPKLGRVDLLRDEFEIALLQGAFQRQLPVLGICRGAHIMNVAAGGTIYQDVGSQREGTFLDHLGDWAAYIRREREPNMHVVTILPDTIIAPVMPNSKCLVNSYHHQAIKKVAAGFRVAAVAEDGVVEAIEHTAYPFMVGLQWHADILWDHAGQRDIFNLFVASATHKQNRNHQKSKIFY